ncbi:MAG: MoaD/ThiS family protein [Gammaproteobacteria bacterium]|nr:MoaD/ThiS family protein [Gammaproteobacteria bacterium]
MMIQIRFFASLREKLQLDDCELELVGPLSVEQVWQKVTHDQPMPANVLCAVNLEYVSLEHEVTGGEEVAFFPPVTGG